jgi:hypothetical protein
LYSINEAQAMCEQNNQIGCYHQVIFHFYRFKVHFKLSFIMFLILSNISSQLPSCMYANSTWSTDDNYLSWQHNTAGNWNTQVFNDPSTSSNMVQVILFLSHLYFYELLYESKSNGLGLLKSA